MNQILKNWDKYPYSQFMKGTQNQHGGESIQMDPNQAISKWQAQAFTAKNLPSKSKSAFEGEIKATEIALKNILNRTSNFNRAHQL